MRSVSPTFNDIKHALIDDNGQGFVDFTLSSIASASTSETFKPEELLTKLADNTQFVKQVLHSFIASHCGYFDAHDSTVLPSLTDQQEAALVTYVKSKLVDRLGTRSSNPLTALGVPARSRPATMAGRILNTASRVHR